MWTQPAFITRALACVALPAALMISNAQAATPTPRWTIHQADQPESVVADKASQFLYISNINGQPMEQNGKGYISKVTIDGKVIERHWINGLDAPKGMAIHADHLYIADLQTLHVVSLSSAQVVQRYRAPQAKMLNDVTVDDSGVVYVTDLLGGGIYRLEQTAFELWFSHEQLPHPNGILWHQGDLIVANWGLGMHADFSTDTPGTLYRLNPAKRSLTPVATGYELGNLDGIVIDGDNLYVSDWISGDLYKLSGNERHKALKLKSGLADIGGANGLIFAPMMRDNEISAWSLGE